MWINTRQVYIYIKPDGPLWAWFLGYYERDTLTGVHTCSQRAVATYADAASAALRELLLHAQGGFCQITVNKKDLFDAYTEVLASQPNMGMHSVNARFPVNPQLRAAFEEFVQEIDVVPIQEQISLPQLSTEDQVLNPTPETLVVAIDGAYDHHGNGAWAALTQQGSWRVEAAKASSAFQTEVSAAVLRIFIKSTPPKSGRPQANQLGGVHTC